MAFKALNGQYVKHLEIKLYLSWTNQFDEDLTKFQENENFEFGRALLSPNASRSYTNLDSVFSV